jgi:DNA-binding NarL/FixJ family response regulator
MYLPLLLSAYGEDSPSCRPPSAVEVPLGEQPGKACEALVTYSILIADDSAALRRAMRTWLEQNRDWKVCGEAVNGKEAIEKAKLLRPDLIILDLSMPVMNGFDAARELKRIVPAIPLLMFTNYETPRLEKDATAVGCAALVSKSEPRFLLESVLRLLPARG